MKIPLVRIVWAVITVVAYIAYKVYSFGFPTILLNALPLLLLWLNVFRSGWKFLGDRRNYIFYMLAIMSAILFERIVYGLLPSDGDHWFISNVLSLCLIFLIVYSAVWLKGKRQAYP